MTDVNHFPYHLKRLDVGHYTFSNGLTVIFSLGREVNVVTCSGILAVKEKMIQ